MNKVIKIILPTIFVIIISLFVYSNIFRYFWRDPLLEIHILNMDSGRAVFVVTPNGKTILIDGGKNTEILRRLSKLMPFYEKDMYMIIDRGGEVDKKDFSEGLKDVLDRYKVVEMIGPTKLDISKGGVIYKEDGEQNFEIKAVFPINSNNIPENKSFNYSKSSPPSIVIELAYGCCRYLFLGDASPAIQSYIAQYIDTKDIFLVELANSGSVSNISKKLKSKIDSSGNIRWIPYNKKSPDRTFFSDGETFWESI